ncbi:CHAT domain-containing protein [Streptomyces sp. NPDC059862]|uniref:CHAT domain-containing protein n=1 Tax=Streptomyces sp. NPDC059862 TaxID=3346975 RepID=UPI00364B4A03
MTELRDRVAARLVAAQNARDPAPLRTQEAVDDALALLREAAPLPEEPVELGPVAAVFWTFWFRHQGPEDPEVQQNLFFVLGAFGFLCPRLPESAGLPEALRESFDPADPSHDARFAHLVSSAHADAVVRAPDPGEPEPRAALDRALAWSDSAIEYVLAEDHAGLVELAFHTLQLNVTRFQVTADPDGLAAAARYARAVCRGLASVPPGFLDPARAQEVAAVALSTLMDAARLLGAPPLALVERLVAAAPDGALAPEAAEGLRLLRELYGNPVTWPGERDLRVGAVIADAGIREHDAGRIACAVRRLRASLAETPAGHPAHSEVTAVLGQALAALGRECGDEEATREAAELLDGIGAVSEEDQELVDAYLELQELGGSDDPRRAGPAVARLVEQFRQRAARQGDAPDIQLEILDLMTRVDDRTGEIDPDAISDERITRYRTALAALPADEPQRHAYVAVLAALTGLRGQALRRTAPDRAELLAAQVRQLTEEALVGAPADFLASGLLQRGVFDAALSVALMSVPMGTAYPQGLIGSNGEPVDGADEDLAKDLARMTSYLSRMNDLRLDDPENLDADIEVIREMLADTDEEDPAGRATLSAALGSALFARAAGRGDPSGLEEVVELLRYARAHAPDMSGQVDRILAEALTTLSIGRFDAEGAREAAALLASSAAAPGLPTDEEEPADGYPVLTDTDRALLAARTELHNALQNYLFGHEPAQLERAREVARRMKELARDAPAGAAGAGPHWYDLMGDAYADLVETVGPAGGPRPDLTDEVVDQCRRTFAACPAGHPMRPMVTMTLTRALMQRAVALRGTEPERAARLMAEADDLSDILEAELPDGSPIDLVAMMRTFIDLIGRGRLPEVSSSDTPSPRTPQTPEHQAFSQANPLASLMAPMLARLSGVADPGAWRDPAIPVWMRASGEIGAAAGALGRPQPRIDLALSHLEAAVEAMADVTDRGSDQQSAEHGLVTFEGDIRAVVELVLMQLLGREGAARLSARLDGVMESIEAAAAEQRVPELPDFGALFRTVEGPDVDRAAELLERGRGLLLARRIEARADIGDLRSAHPALAAEFERLTDQLADEPEVPDPAPPGHAEWARLARLRASRELDELVERIRTQPGFDGFLRPLTAEELRTLAADGPVVVLNHGKSFCLALVVTHRSITALHLEPGADEIADAARRLRDAVDAINAHGRSRPSPAQLVAAGATVRETLAWTWHKIVRPVLELVGAADPVPRQGVWPRVWWVPTGAFSALPLHAAQCTSRDCELDGCGAALDAVVSSYVPGLQTLAYARTRARDRDSADHGGALLVAAPEDELPGVAAAAGYAAELLGAREPLVGAAATREAVLAELGSTSWAHFGCHAATDPAEPSGALLHLPSGETVSVLEICRARPRSAQLAFLAACGTARTAERLTDEAIHITSSFLLAGFPTAVGTLWEIDSAHADHVTRDFYRRMTGDGAATAAHALHDTVRQLRRRIPDRPHIWAAYVHAGT